MKWENHDRWAQKLGIAEEVSREVNNLVDAINTDEGLYAEFENKKHGITRSLTDDDEIAVSKRTFDAVAAINMGDHDGSQKKTTDAKLEANAKLKFLQSKGEEYVKVWYLHHYLDYLVEDSRSGNTIEELLDAYRQENHRQIHSQEIENFLLTHKDDLASELNI